MGVSRLLTEIRKIVREEINIAMDEITKKTDKRITEVLTKRLTTSKTNVAASSKPQQKPLPKTDKDLIRQVKESLGGNNIIKPKQLHQNSTQRVNTIREDMDILPESFKTLPSHLKEALAQTSRSLMNGTTPRLGQDIDTQNYGDDYRADIGNYTTDDVVISSSKQRSLQNDVPDFLSSAISRAGVVAKKAEEFSKK